MAITKTDQLLPKVFQTETNKKFLGATVDNLVTESNIKIVNGYVGRKFAPDVATIRDYVTEPSINRTNYQLEPAVVVKNPDTNKVEHTSSYEDLLRSIASHGGFIGNPNRLFSSEYYVYDPNINWDMFVNYSQYYWVPNGPNPIEIEEDVNVANVVSQTTATIGNIPLSNGMKIKFKGNTIPATYENKEYYVEGVGKSITLVFTQDLLIENSANKSFYDPSESFTDQSVSSLNPTRTVLTIDTNGFNGDSLVTGGDFSDPTNIVKTQNLQFSFPFRAGLNEQSTQEISSVGSNVTVGVSLVGIPFEGLSSDFYINEENQLRWNYDSTFIDFQNTDSVGGFLIDDGVYCYRNGNFILANAWSSVEGFSDGFRTSDDTHSKLVGFSSDGYPIYGPYGYSDPNDVNSSVVRMQSGYEINSTLPQERPSSVEVKIYDLISNTSIFVDSSYRINPGMKITAINGESVVSNVFVIDNSLSTIKNYKKFDGLFNQVDFSDSISSLNLSENDTITLSFLPGTFVEDYIFTDAGTLDEHNGRFCKTPEFPQGTYAYFITIDENLKPAFPYIIGKSFYGDLTVVPSDELQTPDYVLINRSSRDGNFWSRKNRWFHKSILEISNTSINGDDKGKRPIIEFESNLQLFNFGNISLGNVDIFDNTITKAFLEVNGQSTATLDNIFLQNGMLVIFSAEEDLEIRRRIYRIRFEDDIVSGTGSIILLDEVSVCQEKNVITVVNGDTNVNKNYWFNGDVWVEGQTKTDINQFPKFDVVDQNGISFGDRTVYPPNNVDTTFNGTNIFGYAINEFGVNDSILNIPVKYRSLNNISDIIFENYFYLDKFTYNINGINYTKNINSGYIYKNLENGSTEKLLVWKKQPVETRQNQIISYFYDGLNPIFYYDVIPEQNLDFNTISVFVNFNLLSPSNYNSETLGQIFINPDYNIVEGDKIDIVIYSKNESTDFGYFQIPPNLEFNSENLPLSSCTLGELRGHVNDFIDNNTEFSGNYPGISNLRDLETFSTGGKILKHSAPLIYSSLFLTSENYNFVNSVIHAQKEYTRFKNKFLFLAESFPQYQSLHPKIAVDAIVKEINSSKSKNSPFYWSDMIPHGRETNRIKYSVIDPFENTYGISNIYNPYEIKNTAISVYLNQNLLVFEKDYYFSLNSPNIVFTDNITFSSGDEIIILEYSSTEGNFIPETPSKMGLFPKYYPEYFEDTSYSEVQGFIRNHDGSLTPRFYDFRDTLLLELERRIFNNIKISSQSHLLDFYNSRPGKFRETDYSLTEFNSLASFGFYDWVSSNNIENWEDNTIFDTTNSFTYNYSNSVDQTGESLVGSWRAIFEYYYDTQRPNTHPWEMLGMSMKPDWWDSEYGIAPYTSGNTHLWEDIRDGRIRQGTNAGVYPIFSRPEIFDYLPVDGVGNIISPFDIFSIKIDERSFRRNWTFGNYSPVETAWKNSSEYRFYLQIVFALQYPAKYFSYGINTDSFSKNNELNHFLMKNSNNYITPFDIKINGYTENQVTEKTIGYINWISEFQNSLGVVDKSILKNFIQNSSVRLMHKLGGFTSKDKIKIITDQYSPSSINNGVIIPDEDFDLITTKSSPVSNPVYSAIIVEKTTSGFSIKGYNNKKPYFIIRLSSDTGKKKPITVLNRTVDFSERFQPQFAAIPYGTSFSTLQQLTEFISGYQNYLNFVGFIFDDYDINFKEIRNWELSIKELLFWAQQEWQNGSTILLSPVGGRIKFKNQSAVVDTISNSFGRNRILDQNFKPIPTSKFFVNRDGNDFTLTLENYSTDTISLADFSPVEIEHSIIFNNKTKFNDIIYEPVLGQRQYRLKLVGYKTTNWTGAYLHEGFILNEQEIDVWEMNVDYRRGQIVQFKNLYYVAKENIIGTTTFEFSKWMPIDEDSFKTGLIKNLASQAQALSNLYNVDKVNLEESFDQYAFSLIGYKNRNYLSNLGINDTTQIKFYQGFITQKGTKNSINALGKIIVNKNQTEAIVGDEWAFRVGSYGSIGINQYIELKLNEETIESNPLTIEIRNNNEIYYNSKKDNNGLYEYSDLSFSGNVFLPIDTTTNREEEVYTAGFPHFDDINYTVFSLEDIRQENILINDIGLNSTLWVAKDFAKTWNVYKLYTNNNNIVSIENNLNSKLKINTSKNHNLVKNEIVALKNVNEFSGFYQVETIVSKTSFVISFLTEDISTFTSRSFDNASIVYVRSLKVSNPSDIKNAISNGSWYNDSKFWVTNGRDYEWEVYRKTNPWQSFGQISLFSGTSMRNTGIDVALSDDSQYAIVSGSNERIVNLRLRGDNYEQFDTDLLPISTEISEFGRQLEERKNRVFISAPNSVDGTGMILVYERNSFGRLSLKQTLFDDYRIKESFGKLIKIADDANFLIVSGNNVVSLYAYTDNILEFTTIISTGVQSSLTEFSLPTLVIIPSLITITSSDGDKLFINGRDYVVSTVDGESKIIFFMSLNGQYGDIIINYSKGYTKIESLPVGSENFTISLDITKNAETIAVGLTNINDSTDTKINLYDRSIQKYIISDSSVKTFSHKKGNRFSVFNRVYLNSTQLTFNVDFTYNENEIIISNDVQLNVGDIITIETNIIKLFKTITTTLPTNKFFGQSVKISKDGASVYVGSRTFTTNEKSEVGVVERFINKTYYTGNYISDIFSSTVNVVSIGDYIRINDYIVTFTGTSLQSVVDDINNTRIPGVTATINTITDNQFTLEISYFSTNRYKVLYLKPGSDDILTKLKITLYSVSEVIPNPTNHNYDYFGTSLELSEDNKTLFVSSPDGTAVQETTFDLYFGRSYGVVEDFDLLNEKTTFDNDSTKFIDKAKCGAVWVFSRLENSPSSEFPWGSIAYSNQLTPENFDFSSEERVKFGHSFVINSNKMLVSAIEDTPVGSTRFTGTLYKFDNNTNLSGWDVFRNYEGKVDLNSVTKSFIYDNNTKLINFNLDYIDPAKGKIIGVAEQDIKYKTDYDPAIYNYSTVDTVNTSSNFSWNDTQVGEVWWDLSTVSYIEYEQGTLAYRGTNWGKLFPGSTINVYEWVESTVPPSQWVDNGNDGIPAYEDDSAYSTIEYVDSSTGIVVIKYYFWVKDITTVPNKPNRKLPVTTIANYILDPIGNGFKFFAPLKFNSIGLYNVNNSINENSIFHLDYKNKLSENVIHTEYYLLSEDNSNKNKVPISLYNKFVDSLSGLDYDNNAVPDISLPVSRRYGINVRPRQSVVQNRLFAIKNTITFINSVFEEFPISTKFNLTNISGGEPLPSITSDVNNPNFYNEIVNNKSSLDILDVNDYSVGYKVLVELDETSENYWTIYELDSDKIWQRIRTQGWKTSDYWEYADWFASDYNLNELTNYTTNTFFTLSNSTYPEGSKVKVLDDGSGNWREIRITQTGYDIIAIQNGTIKLLDSLWDFANNGLGFDAVGFDSDLFDKNPGVEIREILFSLYNDIFIQELSPKFVKLFFNILNYILNEQKFIDWAFKTSFITVSHQVGLLDTPKIYTKVSSDYFKEYIDEVKPYHTTVREFLEKYTKIEDYQSNTTDFDLPPVLDSSLDIYRSPSGELPQDASLLENIIYSDWKENYTYTLTGIRVYDGGTGYNTKPNISVTIGNTTSQLTTSILLNSGSISSVEILGNLFTNITTSPTITVDGDGSGAILIPIIENNTIRKVKTNIKFDRISYGNEPSPWLPRKNYKRFEIISYTTSSDSNSVSPTSFDASPFDYYNFDETEESAVRTKSSWVVLRDFTSTDTFSPFVNVYNEVTETWTLRPILTPFNGFLEIKLWEPNTKFYKNQIVVFGSQIFVVIDNFTSGSTFLGNNLFDISKEILSEFNLDANQRILIYYDPTTRMPSKDLEYLQRGVAYPGLIVRGSLFNEVELNEFTLDSITESINYNQNVDDAEILIDGDEFVTPEYSYAPEEMLPGRVYDTLDMKILTLSVDPLSSDYINWLNMDAYTISGLRGNIGANIANITNVVVSGFKTAGDIYSNLNSYIASSIEITGITVSNGSIDLSSISVNDSSWTYISNVVVNYTANANSIVTDQPRLWTNVSPIWSNSSVIPKFNYHIWKDKNDINEYIATNIATTAILVSNLEANINYANIEVNNASILPEPTIVVSINEVFAQALNRRMDVNSSNYITNISNISFSNIENAVYEVYGNVQVYNSNQRVIVDETIYNPKEGIYIKPGVVMINGERMEYWSKFNEGNILVDVRRGTRGTSIHSHFAGEKVYDYTRTVPNVGFESFKPLENVVISTQKQDEFFNFDNLLTEDGREIYTEDNLILASDGYIVLGSGTYVFESGQTYTRTRLFGLPGQSTIETENNDSIILDGVSDTVIFIEPAISPTDGRGIYNSGNSLQENKNLSAVFIVESGYLE